MGVSACARPLDIVTASIPLERVAPPGVETVPVEPVQHERPLFVGDGLLSYRCPQCARLLCQGIAPGDLGGLVIRCRCGATGRVPR